MKSRIADLTDRLDGIDTRVPKTIRRRILDILSDFITADLGLFVKCVELKTGPPHFTGMVCRGDSALRDELHSFADRPAVATPWLPPNLAPDEINTFIRTHNRYEANYLRSFEIVREVFDSLDIQDQLRVVVVHDNQLVGWLGLMRRQHLGVFSRAQQQLLDAAVPAIENQLLRAESLEADRVDGRRCAILRPDGDIEYVSKALTKWLTPGRRFELGQYTDEAHHLDDRHTVALCEGAAIELLRLESKDHQRRRYLATIDHPTLLTIEPEYWLTERQREVARYVISGATSPEIADELNVSAETIKSHLKNIFERLDISSRAELAATLSRPSPAPSSR